MQGIIRVQTRVFDQRRGLSISRQGSVSNNYIMLKDEESEESKSVEQEVYSIIMPRVIKETERGLAYAFTEKIWRCHAAVKSESEGKSATSGWTDCCIETNPWETLGRYSFDQRTPIQIMIIPDLAPTQMTLNS